jgi:glycosyltransferase involved in cell wall biosynthesis
MRNEEAFIETCLASLRQQSYAAERMEFLVLDGASADRSAALVRQIAAHDPRVRLIDNPGRHQASGLNIGVAAATGDIVVRADAHATYGPAYVATCVEHLVAGRADNVGGRQCAATDGRYLGRAIAALLRTPLGAGDARYRLATSVCYTDTVWLGAWYRRTLLDLGGFDETFVTNEDYEFNCRLRAAGGRILLDPSLESSYYVRPSLKRLAWQYFRYGEGKVRTLRRHPRSLKVRQALPALLTAMLLGAMALAPWSWLPLAIIGGGYLAILLLGSLQAAREDWTFLPALPIIALIIHQAWGCGFLWALITHGGLKRLGGMPPPACPAFLGKEQS